MHLVRFALKVNLSENSRKMDSTPDSETFQTENFSNKLVGKFGWEEYAVFAVVLLFSTAIGLYYGIFKRKEQNQDEYLMG